MEKIVNPTIIGNRSVLYGESAPYRNKNLFIEAGAGAGKTDYIIKKIVDELLQGVEPKKFIVITFTNKATEEMLGRIIKGINERINDTKNFSEKERAILKNAKDKMFEMNVSTIHSFCNTLLNENSFSSKLAFGAELIEEKDEEKRKNDCFSRWLKTLNSTENYELFGISAENLIHKVKNTYDVLCNNFDNVQINDSFKYNPQDFFDACDAIYDALISSDYELGKTAQEFIEQYEKLNSDPNKDLNKCISEYDAKTLADIEDLVTATKKNVNVKGAPKQDKEAISELVLEACEIKDIAEPFFENIYVPIINKYALKAWEYFKKNRDRETLSNNQLIYEAYKLLQDDNICNTLAKKYDVVFIDEFQDTDKCQIEFIIKLARAIDARKKKEKNDTTSLVVVGDPKQSIYRFRGADFTSFSKVQSEFRSYGDNFEPVFFPDNFRSNDYIINYVNEVFATKNLADGYVYNKMDIAEKNYVGTVNANNFLAGVYSYGFNSKDDKFNDLARFIKYLVDIKYQILKNHEPHEVGYEDFLVLSASHSEMNEYIKALNFLNIPSQIAGEFDLSSSVVIRIITRILKYLLDKQENNKLLVENILNNYVINPELALEKIDKDTSDMSCYGKLLYVLSNLKLVIDEFTATDEYLYHAISEQILEKLCVNEFVSDAELINKLDELLSESVKSEISLDPNSKAVRLMNVHQSKGLQGRIVIMVDSGGFAPESSCKLCGSTLYLNNTSILPGIKDKVKKEVEQEKVRLEYVAATRAEQVLIFEEEFTKQRLFNLSGDNSYDFSKETLEVQHYPGTELPSVDDVDKHFDKENVSSSKGVEVTFLGNKHISDSLLKKEYESLSPSLLEDHSDTSRGTIKPRRPADNIFGTTFHRVMELYVKNDKQDINEIINKAITENINDIGTNDVDKYKRALNECLLSVKALFESKGYLNNVKERKPEFKFVNFDEVIYDNKPTLMSGSIDLLLLANDQAIVIDYKTDIAKFQNIKQFEELLKMTYSKQLETYKKLVKKLYGIDKVSTKIIWMEETATLTVAHEVDITK